METLLKNDNLIVSSEDKKNILKGYDDVKNGRVMDVDTAMKKFIIEREAWKSIK